MKVSQLGEFGLIDLLAKMINNSVDKSSPSWQQLILGIGDDTAAWHGETAIQLATVDSFIQDVHFSLNTASWEDIGWKALAINLSDIAAMGGMPKYALVSLSLPGHTDIEDATALYKGMIELAQQTGVAIVGGDTDSAPLVALTITVFGNAGQDKRLLTRSAARPGDQVAVTGYLGAASAGFKMLTNKLTFAPEDTNSLKEAFLRPEPRIAEGQLLAQQGIKAAIDISDGLIADLKHICQNSKVSAQIEVDRVPVHTAVKANFKEKALELALYGGED